MKTLNTSSQRSQQARLNGAKSRGPKTPQGKEKARLAPLRHGLYATEQTLLATINTDEFQKLREDYYDIWNPINRDMQEKVEDLIRARWQLNRLYEVRQDYFNEIYLDVRITDRSKVTSAELAACEPGHPMGKIELRIRRLSMDISRLEQDLIRLTNHFEKREASHKPNKTRPLPPDSPWVPGTQDKSDRGLPLPAAPNAAAPPAFGGQPPPETSPSC